MMTNSTDIQDRQQALDISRSFIVKAPAGSGKTTLLVKRYLKLLSVVNHPEEIIAITFTRKAAGELIARVMNALTQEKTNGTGEYVDHELIEIAAKVRLRDKREGWQLIGNPSKLRIQTIDSLCHYIVRQMPWSAGFGAAPSNVSDDVSSLYYQAARQALINALSDAQHTVVAENVLTALDNDFSRACELIKTMLARRDQWHGLLSQHTGENARKILEENWAHVIHNVLASCLQNITLEDRRELLELGQYAADNLLKSATQSAICDINRMDEFPGIDVNQLASWKAITTLLLTKELKLRKTVNVKIGFPPLNKGGEENKKENFLALLARLQASQAESSFAQVAALPDSTYSNSEWQLLESLLIMLRIAQRELLDIFQHQACCDHIEIASRAVVALSQGVDDGPSELALRLDYAIKHLLIDEFQDTSRSQMLLIKRLTAGWQGDDQRTVFFVGDPMQSIYRFRQADVGLFLNLFNNGFENTQVTALTLTTNFRSSRPVVDWVNKAFEKIFPLNDDMQFGAVGYEPSIAHKRDSQGNDGQTTHTVTGQAEADEICRLIQTVRKQTPNASIAILVRGRTHLTDIVVALKKSAIEYQGVKIEQLKNRSCIQDILALTAALLHFGDKLAWLAILRAPWCGLSLPDLTLIADESRVKTIWQVINSPPEQLSRCAHSRLDRIIKVLMPILESVGKQPLNHVVARAWHGLSGPDTIHPGEMVNINTYINLLGDIQLAGGLKDLNQLETAMEDLWAVSGHDGSDVQLMTMHTAKGLEFDVVVLPGLARRPRADDSKLLFWREFVLSDQDSRLLVSPIKQENEDARYKFIQSLEKQSDREEIKRLLYVAATRAKSQLHLFVTPIKPRSSDTPDNTGTSLQSFLEPVLKLENQIDNDLPMDSTNDCENKNLTNVYFRLPLGHKAKTYVESLGITADEVKNELVEYEWVGVSARHEGTLMHEIICQMANGTFLDQSSNNKRWHNRLLSYGMQAEQIKNSIEKIRLTIRHMLNDSQAQWILDSTHKEAKNEYPLSAIINNRLENVIIDRTFKDKHGVRWIIDYKTSTHYGANVQAFIDSELERYRPQLDNYAAILRLSDSGPIKLGLYFPLLKAWREWDYAG